jgi:hypothetical protein
VRLIQRKSIGLRINPRQRQTAIITGHKHTVAVKKATCHLTLDLCRTAMTRDKNNLLHDVQILPLNNAVAALQ